MKPLLNRVGPAIVQGNHSHQEVQLITFVVYIMKKLQVMLQSHFLIITVLWTKLD